MSDSILKLHLLFLIFFISVSSSHSSATEMKALELEPNLICLQDPEDPESSNSFLIKSQGHNLLIDAGWSSKSKIPAELVGPIGSAIKVATHFHFDHIRRWSDMVHIALSEHQQTDCTDWKCRPSFWKSILSVKEFSYDLIYKDNERLGPTELLPVRCDGHSNTDACFIDPVSRTLFLGDLFYLGPVFYFLPGGSLKTTISTLTELLKRKDWDEIALTHGSCARLERQVLSQFVEELSQVDSGEIKGRWSFDFWIPLRAYDISTGTIYLRPVFR